MLDAISEIPTSKIVTKTLVLGAGPVGLAAAAHLASRGLRFELLEASDAIAASVRQWSHVKLFSPWRYNIDPTAAGLLEETGWQAPDPDSIPTGRELIDLYLLPLSRHPQIAPHIRLGARVRGVARAGADKIRTQKGSAQSFTVLVSCGDAGETVLEADHVLDATGTWGSPNPVGGEGLEAAGEAKLRDRLYYGLPDLLGVDAERFRGRHTAVIGSGLSAATALVGLSDLAEQDPNTKISWIIRGALRDNLFGGGDRDELPARGRLGANLARLAREERLSLKHRFRVRSIDDAGGELILTGMSGDRQETVGPFDEIIVATGQRPDHSLTRELRTEIDPRLESVAALAPLVDPNLHYCGSVEPHGFLQLSYPEEPGFFTLGSKSYGRAPSFLMATGYEQVRSVVAGLAGDMAAALSVQLKLPATGICSTDMPGCCATESSGADSSAAASCCGPAPAAASSCCGPVAVEPAEPAGASCCNSSASAPVVVLVRRAPEAGSSWSRQALSLAMSRQQKPRGSSGSCCG